MCPTGINMKITKNFYACKKILGGGALMTECHEIDLIICLFGVPKSLICKKKIQ